MELLRGNSVEEECLLVAGDDGAKVLEFRIELYDGFDSIVGERGNEGFVKVADALVRFDSEEETVW